MSSNATTVEKTKEPAKEAAKTPVFEPDDLVSVVHRNWHANDPRTHQPFIRDDQETFLDRITFVGGVARNVPYELARQWVKLGMITSTHIFANNAQSEDFSKALGRDAMAPQTLAGAVSNLSTEKAIAILGEEGAAKFAKSLLQDVSSREKQREQ